MRTLAVELLSREGWSPPPRRGRSIHYHLELAPLGLDPRVIHSSSVEQGLELGIVLAVAIVQLLQKIIVHHFRLGLWPLRRLAALSHVVVRPHAKLPCLLLSLRRQNR